MKRWLLVMVYWVTLGMEDNAQTVQLLIFGGDRHKEFLGCLNCSEMDATSVWNDMSQYGWGNGFGVWNPFGPYKNPFASQSACNEFANDPPVIVDRAGNAYGYLTVNEYKPGSVCAAQGVQKLCTALKVMCTQS
jgi:hypothetical protein